MWTNEVNFNFLKVIKQLFPAYIIAGRGCNKQTGFNLFGCLTKDLKIFKTNKSLITDITFITQVEIPVIV